MQQTGFDADAADNYFLVSLSFKQSPLPAHVHYSSSLQGGKGKSFSMAESFNSKGVFVEVQHYLSLKNVRHA